MHNMKGICIGSLRRKFRHNTRDRCSNCSAYARLNLGRHRVISKMLKMVTNAALSDVRHKYCLGPQTGATQYHTITRNTISTSPTKVGQSKGWLSVRCYILGF